MLTQLAKLLDAQGRRQYLLLAALSVLSSLFQTAGVAAISLFFTSLLGGNLPGKIQDIASQISFAGLGGLVLLLLVLGTGSSAFATYYGIQLAWRQYQRIASQILRNYLYRDYEWHLGQNSAALSKTVITETHSIVINVLQQVVMILVRGSEILLIGGLLVVTRPLIALVATGSFLFIYGGLYRLNRSSILAQSRIVAQANTDRQRAVNEALAGIKAIKVSRLEGFFVDSFDQAALKLSGATAKIQYFSLLPKYFIELLIFGGLVSFVVLSHSRNWSANESIPLLALYGAAAIRLLPAAQQLYSSITTVVGAQASLKNVLDGLVGAASVVAQRGCSNGMSSKTLMAFQSVSYTYAGAATASLSDFNVTITQGDKIGIVGATGAGKTTVVDLLLDLLQPSSGRITRATQEDGHALVAYVPQQLHFIDDTIAANIALGQAVSERSLEKIEAAAKQARIHDHIITLPQGYHTMIGESGARLSGGQRQRIGIARALYREPALLILDEASNALDAKTERQVISSLLEQNLTLLIIAHRISILRGCTRILVLEHGRLVAEGTFDQLYENNGRFRALASADLGQEAVL